MVNASPVCENISKPTTDGVKPSLCLPLPGLVTLGPSNNLGNLPKGGNKKGNILLTPLNKGGGERSEPGGSSSRKYYPNERNF